MGERNTQSCQASHWTLTERTECLPNMFLSLKTSMSTLHCLNFMINLYFYQLTRHPTTYFLYAKRYYCQCIIQELGLNSQSGNPTYSSTTFSEYMLDNHTSVLSSFGINVDKDSFELPYIYWIPKWHKTYTYNCWTISMFYEAFFGFAQKILSTFKDGLRKYCSTSYSRNGVNQMWILNLKISSTTFIHLTSIMYILFNLIIFLRQFHTINLKSDLHKLFEVLFFTKQRSPI